MGADFLVFLGGCGFWSDGASVGFGLAGVWFFGEKKGREVFDTLSRFSSQITQYQSNNRGRVPTDWGAFISDYMQAANDTFEDPDGTAYNPSPQSGPAKGKTATLPTDASLGQPDHNIYIYPNAHCGSNEKEVEYSGGSRNLAFLYILEGNGVYCGTN